MAVVEGVLADINAAGKPALVVFNKIDLLDQPGSHHEMTNMVAVFC